MRWAIGRGLVGIAAYGVVLGAALLWLSVPTEGRAQSVAQQLQSGPSPQVQRGVVIARTYCARCHSIDKLSPSSVTEAPPFRDLHKRYPVELLEEPLAEGLLTGHPAMPEFRFEPDQINDFIAFLKSLE